MAEVNGRKDCEVSCDCVFFVGNGDKNKVWTDHYDTCQTILQKRRDNGEFPFGLPRNKDGSLRIQNPHLRDLDGDFLYHLALGTKTHDLPTLFGDIKFVCMGGTSQRMFEFAKMAAQELGCDIPVGFHLQDMTVASHRYSLYKIGPVISINHGIGVSTLSVVLQEVIKLLQYCGARDPVVFRIGTSGGIGIEPGSVVVSKKGYDGLLDPVHEVLELGVRTTMPAILDERLAQELTSLGCGSDGFQTVMGNTMCSNDFYNGQGRLDGPFCEYTLEQKMQFLQKLKQHDIKNIEMEVTCFAALTHKAGIKAADVCVTLLNRLNGDQVVTPKEVLLRWQERPMLIVLRYMQAYLKSVVRYPYGKV